MAVNKGALENTRAPSGGIVRFIPFIDITRAYGDGKVHPDHHWIAFDPKSPHTLYLCTDGGIFKSPNLGETWEPRNKDLATVQFVYLDVHPTDPGIAYGGTQDNGTLKFTGNYF